MGKRGTPPQDPRLRLLIAQTAARLMADEGIRDFAQAKRKAAARKGIHDNRNLPANDEIQAALEEYQRVFQSHSQPETVMQLRFTALEAMCLLADFQPCLVGPALDGSADENTPVYLHLFADTPEEVLIHLMEQQVPFDQGERRVEYANGRTELLPKFSFFAGDIEIQLTVFHVNGRRQAPLSPVDGRPQRRADRAQLEAIMEADQGEG